MFRWITRRLVAWVEERQRREIARLHLKTMQFKEEVERTTGGPVQLSPDEKRHLAKKARGIDPEVLKQISIFDPEELKAWDSENDSTENP
jgi:hypothetical protein